MVCDNCNEREKTEWSTVVNATSKTQTTLKTVLNAVPPLYLLTEGRRSRRRDDECFGARGGVEPRERVEEECFDIPKGKGEIITSAGLAIIKPLSNLVKLLS